MRIAPVELDYVNATWPMVEQYIDAALNTEAAGTPTMTIEHMRVMVVTGQFLLCVAVDDDNKIHGACTISFYNEPLHRIAFVNAIGGKLVCNRDTMEQFKAILRIKGATMVKAYGRPSIVRLWRRYNFTPTYTLLELPL